MTRPPVHLFLSLILITLAAGVSPGCRRRPRTAERQWPAMGTRAVIAVPLGETNSLPEYASSCAEHMDELESLLSVYRSDSEISRLNASAGRSAVNVSRHTRAVLELALLYARRTGGLFDPAVAPLMKLWGFRNGRIKKPPDEASISAALRLAGYSRLELSGNSAFLNKAGSAVDLGGIAKGYAVDVCYTNLSASGAANFLVNLGGNMRCRGVPDPRNLEGKWKIGVRNPFDADSIIGTILLPGGMAVATSGSYERFVTIDGARYCHIIDPRTGYPVSGTAGVTVIAPTATEADALSTALFAAGPEGAGEILRAYPDCRALIVPDGRPPVMKLSRGFHEWFRPEREFSSSAVSLAGQ
ncbi:MAG: FAD:protein FMN transferase [Kiritimatiellia bacterium]